MVVERVAVVPQNPLRAALDVPGPGIRGSNRPASGRLPAGRSRISCGAVRSHGMPGPSVRSENAAVSELPSVRSRNPIAEPRKKTPSAAARLPRFDGAAAGVRGVAGRAVGRAVAPVCRQGPRDRGRFSLFLVAAESFT